MTLVLALTPLGGAFANPQGGQVVGGQATIQGQGTKTVTVNQSSQNAIINWNTFNIGAGELTQFNQPNANAIVLNRVTGNMGPSQIYGTITANGRVFLVNPDGILFGLGSRVDAAGFLASTNDIRNRAFMHGHYHFNIPGRLDASIVNLGRINATNGGFAALVAPGVRNAGVITANLGHVALASGNGFTLDFYGDKLITLQVDHGVANQVIDVATGQPLTSLVENQGKLRANGGAVALTAAAARTVVDSVINNTGVIEANSVGTHNGMIVLGAATAGTKPQDAPTQNVVVSGTISARGTKAHQTGGTVVVTGEQIALQGARVNASGTAGGGTVLIGGNRANPATNVTVDRNSVIDARATQNGNGGKVVIWGNQLTVAGLIAASGGPFGGNGGFVETSGQWVNFDGLSVDTSAPHGTSGLWLVDPYNLVIDATAAATIAGNLATTSVTLQTTADGASGPGNVVAGAGDIIINSGIAWSSGSTLTLSAYNGITVNAPINIQGAGGLSMSAANTPGLANVPLITFGSNGSVQFTGTPNTGQSLVINGQSYTLLYNMSDVQAINANGKSLEGLYALAKPIDASGVSGWVPIGTDTNGNVLNDGSGFTGAFQGLGNNISNLTINDLTVASSPTNAGLFGVSGGVISNLALTNASITAGSANQNIGVLAGTNYGIISNVSASGTIDTGNFTRIVAGGLVGQNLSSGVVGGTAAVNMTVGTGLVGNWNVAGGLVGTNYGLVQHSSASGTISGADAGDIGGLVGSNYGNVIYSFATGNVSGGSLAPIDGAYLGGLVGVNWGGASISYSYASGNVSGLGGLNIGADLGGFIGPNWGSISNSYALGNVNLSGNGGVGGFTGGNWAYITQSYSTGYVSGTANGSGIHDVGGFASWNAGTITSSYWDTTTSGQDANHGVGRGDGYFGAVGLTTAQFGNASNFSGWSFGETPGGLGWVIVDVDSSLNNSGNAAGATRPMLLSEWSTTITNAHQLQLIVLNPSANYTLANNIDLGPALSNPSEVWGPNATSGFVPIGANGVGLTILVGQCLTDQACTTAPFTAWSSSLTLAQLNALGSETSLQADQTAPYVIRLGTTTVTFTTPGGPVVERLSEFSGGYHDGLCTICENDTVGTFSIPGNASAATISGTFGNSVVFNSSPVNVLLASTAPVGFSGTFNGNGHAISNLAINQPTQTNVGLFGVVAAGGVIENIRLNGGNVNGGQNVGAVVGQNNGTVSNVRASVGVNGSDTSGGLVGLNNAAGIVTDASASGSVYSTVSAGGLVGSNQGSISQSFATGTVTGTTLLGGLVGSNGAFNGGAGTITQSYATGIVSGSATVGGLVGQNFNGTITGSYATGSVIGTTDVGGLVGINDASITQSWAGGSVGGTLNAGGLVGTNENGASVTNAYALGAVTGTVNVGGLIGDNSAQVADTYATGAVVGTIAVGALVGLNNGNVASSYWDMQTGGQQGVGTSGGIFGATGLTTTQFGNISSFAGWTFGTTPGAPGWVVVDADGSLNNANGAPGATRPMLLSEWSTTITNPHQLELINLDLSANYRLANNIGLGAPLANPSRVFAPNGAAGFVPIGSIGDPFSGTFNGQGYTITGLVMAPVDKQVNSIGLFGANTGVIRNLNLADVAITANPNVGLPGQFVGTLTGQNFGFIGNVTASGAINGLDLAGVTAGGLVGQNGSLGGFTGSVGPSGPINGDFVVVGQNDEVQRARIVHSHADVTVTLGDGIVCNSGPCNGGFNNAGGLVGFNVATIAHSSAGGAITVGANTFAGGLVGTNQNASFDGDGPPVALAGPRIIDSWASGAVSSTQSGVALGGLVGYNAPLAVIWNSHATGDVTSGATAVTADCSPNCAFANAGGLVGQNQGEILGRTLPSTDSGCTAGFTCASGIVSVGVGSTGGGLVGQNQGIIRYAFATGDVRVVVAGGGDFSHTTTLGGLVGGNQGIIAHTFATGAVGDASVANLDVGGLVGDNGGVIWRSAAFGPVTAGANSLAGGLAGDNNPSNSGCGSCSVGDGFNQRALIAHSVSRGSVTVGADSAAGGITAINSGTLRHDRSGSVVTGDHDSVVAGLVGINDLTGLIKYSLAWGSATDTGHNSIVAGLVGLNDGNIVDSRTRATATGGSDSYVGGLVGINFGAVQDANSSGNVAVSGGGNVVGGFAAVNLGSIDPSFASGAIDGGSGSIVGGFAGGNVTIPGFTGTISSDSGYTGPSTTYPQVASTSITSAYPTPPGFLINCNAGPCGPFQPGGPFNPSPPTTPPSTPSVVDTPPTQQQQVILPPNNDNTTQPTLVNLTTTPGNGTGNGNGGNNNGNHNNNAGPPQSPGPPPGPGLGRTYDEQHFSGVPPIGETRFLRGEIVVQISNTVPLATVMKIAQQLGITLISSQTYDVNGRIIYRFSAANGKDIRFLIKALERNNIVASAQPNYVFNLSQSAPAPAAAPAEPAEPPSEQTDSIPPRTQAPAPPDLANADTASLETLPAGDAAQYVIDKMHLVQLHNMARGRNVVVAVIDSEIDVNHPDLKGDILERYDATQTPSHPHVHGTGMAGAIAAHQRLLGVAPGVKLLAIKAFDEQASSAEATSVQILKGLEFAMAHKARVINMSFAGPRDPMLERTLKLAHDKGIILVAAAGNAGPKSPPLYPGADPNVIAVTASDYNDKPFSMANRGKYIAVGAPGVDVMVPAPGNTYQLTTGTSVATAHVSGVAALLVERKPSITPDEVRTILIRTAIPYSARPKGEEDGAGLVDPVAALKALGPSQSVQVVPHTNGLTTH